MRETYRDLIAAAKVAMREFRAEFRRRRTNRRFMKSINCPF